MKSNTIQLNIGLNSGTGPCQPHLVLADLVHHGFRVHQSRIVQGIWEGQPEACLVIVASYVLPLVYRESRLCIGHALCEIAKRHAQDCIAVEWSDGTGDLFPVQAFAFDPKQFHRIESQAPLQAVIAAVQSTAASSWELSEDMALELNSCARILEEHAERISSFGASFL